MKKIIVVGSGISGISSAYFLSKLGSQVEILESSPYPGGRTASTKLGEHTVDLGGKNIGRNYKLFREFVADFGGGEYEYFGVNTSRVVDGKIIPINREKNLKSILNLFRFANPIDLIKIFYLLRKVKRSIDRNGASDQISPYLDERFLVSRYFTSLSNRFDHKPLSSYFSQKCVDNILRTMTVRMNGAEPDECYLGNFGSNLGTAFDKYDQLKTGMAPLLQNFFSKFSVVTSCRVTGLLLDKKRRVVGVKAMLGEKEKEIKSDGVILSVPAPIAGKILRDSIPEISKIMERINYYPVGVCVAEYERDVFNKDVRAVVFGQESILSNAGAYGTEHLNLVRYTFSGRRARDKIHNLSPERLIEKAEKSMPADFTVSRNTR